MKWDNRAWMGLIFCRDQPQKQFYLCDGRQQDEAELRSRVFRSNKGTDKYVHVMS